MLSFREIGGVHRGELFSTIVNQSCGEWGIQRMFGQCIVDGVQNNKTASSKEIRLWDAKTGRRKRTLEDSGITAIAFSPSSHMLVSVGRDVTLWGSATGQ